VHCKLLKGVGMHTYIGMIGYCLKEQGEKHFLFYHKNVNSKHIQEKVYEYVNMDLVFVRIEFV